MTGVRAGGLKAAKTNKLRHGSDFYRKIGAMGGAKSRGGGFAYDRALASRAGKLGGKASRRTAIKQVEAEAKDTAKQHKSWKERLGL